MSQQREEHDEIKEAAAAAELKQSGGSVGAEDLPPVSAGSEADPLLVLADDLPPVLDDGTDLSSDQHPPLPASSTDEPVIAGSGDDEDDDQDDAVLDTASSLQPKRRAPLPPTSTSTTTTSSVTLLDEEDDDDDDDDDDDSYDSSRETDDREAQRSLGVRFVDLDAATATTSATSTFGDSSASGDLRDLMGQQRRPTAEHRDASPRFVPPATFARSTLSAGGFVPFGFGADQSGAFAEDDLLRTQVFTSETTRQLHGDDDLFVGDEDDDQRAAAEAERQRLQAAAEKDDSDLDDDDVVDHLDDVDFGKPSRWQRIKQHLKDNKAAYITAAVITLLLLAGFGTAVGLAASGVGLPFLLPVAAFFVKVGGMLAAGGLTPLAGAGIIAGLAAGTTAFIAGVTFGLGRAFVAVKSFFKNLGNSSRVNGYEPLSADALDTDEDDALDTDEDDDQLGQRRSSTATATLGLGGSTPDSSPVPSPVAARRGDARLPSGFLQGRDLLVLDDGEEVKFGAVPGRQ